MGDQFVSVEHLVAALAEDQRFCEAALKAEGLTKESLAVVRIACMSVRPAQGEALRATLDMVDGPQVVRIKYDLNLHALSPSGVINEGWLYSPGMHTAWTTCQSDQLLGSPLC